MAADDRRGREELGLATLGHGAIDEAERLITDARAEFDATGQGWTEPILLLAEAELARSRDAAADEVAARFGRAEGVARDQGASAVAERIAEAAARCRVHRS